MDVIVKLIKYGIVIFVIIVVAVVVVDLISTPVSASEIQGGITLISQ